MLQRLVFELRSLRFNFVHQSVAITPIIPVVQFSLSPILSREFSLIEITSNCDSFYHGAYKVKSPRLT